MHYISADDRNYGACCLIVVQAIIAPFAPPRHRGYNPGMAIALAIFGVSFAAFCVWLGVRIVNRRERWATRLAVMLAVAMLTWYALGVGSSYAASMIDRLVESMIEQLAPEVRPHGSKS